MTAILSPTLRYAFFKVVDGGLVPLAGGFLYTYASGTSTPLGTWKNAAQSAANDNPIELDDNGQCDLWLGSSAYKFDLFDSAMVRQPGYPVDAVDPTAYSNDALLAQTIACFAGEIPPSNPVQGQLWYQPSASTLWQYSGTVWVSLLSSANLINQTANAYTTAGTAPNFTLTPATALVAYAANIRYRVRWNAAGTTGSNTLNISGLGPKDVKQRTNDGSLIPAMVRADQLSDVEYDGTYFVILNPLPLLNMPVRQTVYEGPVDATGYPSFLPATSASLNLTSQNISASAPFSVTSASGYGFARLQVNYLGQSTANLTWSSLTASQTNYLYVTLNLDGTLTAGFTILPPLYQWAGTPSVTANQHTFNISEMKMYVGNGSSATVVNRVFVGEAVTGVGTVTSTVAYAYSGRYDSGWTTTLPGTATKTSKNHNIGVTPRAMHLFTRCNSAEGNYAVGDVIEGWLTAYTTGGGRFISVKGNSLSMFFTTGATSSFLGVNNNTGADFVPTAAKWDWALIADRGW